MNNFSDKNCCLAPYASKCDKSKGRRYKNEEEHSYRSCYQRDRDRIIHSVAFRRLEYKTQVFVNHEGDDYRTRLTHSLEVAQIARTIAKALNLNEELTEAVSLAHDLGHTPFGHAGEDILNELMSEHGGFNHNLHTLKIVDELEDRYPDFPGLNLTWETREGIVKHSTKYDKTKIPQELLPEEMHTLEAQIVDIADEIAYDNHDLDDGLNSGLIQEEQLKDIEIWRAIEEEHRRIQNPKKRYQVIRRLISLLVDDVIKESKNRLNKFNIGSLEDVKKHSDRLIAFSAGLTERRKPLQLFLKQELYMHYRVKRMSDKARRFINDLFNAYVNNPSILPKNYQNKITDRSPKQIVVCDYIASMTDRFALDEYEKLFFPHKKV